MRILALTLPERKIHDNTEDIVSLENSLAVREAVKVASEKRKSSAYASMFNNGDHDTVSESSGVYLTGIQQ